MNKQITIILGIVLAMPMIFAMIAGTNETVEFSGTVSECFISNNQFDLEGLNLYEEGNNVILVTDVKYKPDNIIVRCLVEGTREEQEHSYSSGSNNNKKKNKVNVTDDIRDLRKELLLRQLIEKRDSNKIYDLEGDLITEGEQDPVVIDDDSETVMNWTIILWIVVIVIIITVIALLIKSKDKEE